MSEPRPVQFTEAEAADMIATLQATRSQVATLERRSAELEALLRSAPFGHKANSAWYVRVEAALAPAATQPPPDPEASR